MIDFTVAGVGIRHSFDFPDPNVPGGIRRVRARWASARQMQMDGHGDLSKTSPRSWPRSAIRTHRCGSTAMSEVITPGAFNEKFTLYLNTEGKPVQRTLREMTADEVLRALEWQGSEADRLNREAEPARQIASAAADKGRHAEIAHLSEAEFDAAALALEKAGEAAERQVRLLGLIEAVMPQWHGSKLPLGKALRRYWPGGRAA